MGTGADQALNGGEAIEHTLRVVARVVGTDARRVTGWATVDLDRATLDVGAGTTIQLRDLPEDPLLGARCRLVTSGVGEGDLVLLEPATEGRIAASLARFGEGPVALYTLVPEARFGQVVRDAVAAGLVLSAEASGPFGRERLVAGAQPWGAHLLMAEDEAREGAPIPPASGAATIER